MQFRYARHSNNLEALIHFYQNLLGFKQLGKFENHAGYNGVFLGLPNTSWHLEFTESDAKTQSIPDEDDLLVFYLENKEELENKIKKAREMGLSPKESKNPYWQKNGIEYTDPDGYGVVLCLRKLFI